MPLPKRPRYRSRPLLDAAAGQRCVLCGKRRRSVCAAHLPGAFYGMPAGTGEKVSDWLVAHVCLDCHRLLDGPAGRRDATLRMRAFCLTLERLFLLGVLTVDAEAADSAAQRAAVLGY